MTNKLLQVCDKEQRKYLFSKRFENLLNTHHRVFFFSFRTVTRLVQRLLDNGFSIFIYSTLICFYYEHIILRSKYIL